MIRQYDAQRLTDDKLRLHGLFEKGWRTNFTKAESWCARCYHPEKRIVISLQFLNSTSIVELEKTILHELAHALVGPGNGHNDIWKAKAKELGLEDPQSCIVGHIDLDAGRSVIQAETKETKKKVFHRINETCPICGKIAIEVSALKTSKVTWSKLECGHLVSKDQIKKGNNYSDWTSKIGKVIFPFQVSGIEFLEKSGGRALIADEPGLGKTIQALGFINAHKEDVTPVLWICKTTLKIQAIKEVFDWCDPSLLPQVIDSPRDYILPGFKLYIISMDLLRNMSTEKLEAMNFKTIVADEVQHFKNPDATRTAELRKLVSKAEYFIALSGTPWKNRGDEYFSVLNMLSPKRFPSYANFKSHWCHYYQDPRTGKWKMGGINNIPRFREYTEDFIIRRLRDDVLPDLPKINRQIRFIDMEGLYTDAYDKMEEKVANFLKAAILEGTSFNLMASEMMQLKHITGLAKVKVCVEDVIEFLEGSEDIEKITIFHHHIDVGDHLQKGDKLSTLGLDPWLKENGYNPSLRLLGGKGPEERNRIVEQFKNDPKSRVLIASTLASGEGLNLQFCQNAVMLERQWNPANEEQAELRFSRPITESELPEYLKPIASRKVSIRVPYMIADKTIDSMLTELIERKRIAFRKTMNDKDANLKWNENEIINELASLILKKRAKK